ncbi:IclR family transcriptional regulator [Halogranum rubrum]|uniref:hypothetical protein n=1 Tax=Halogranum rubrum TaxID=553466 RepID=UPI0011603CC2|nr:hypothetical protein [Halogranum rubrum]
MTIEADARWLVDVPNRYLLLLQIVASSQGGRTVVDLISLNSELSPTTVLTFLYELEQRGMVEVENQPDMQIYWFTPWGRQALEELRAYDSATILFQFLEQAGKADGGISDSVEDDS